MLAELDGVRALLIRRALASSATCLQPTLVAASVCDREWRTPIQAMKANAAGLHVFKAAITLRLGLENKGAHILHRHILDVETTDAVSMTPNALYGESFTSVSLTTILPEIALSNP